MWCSDRRDAESLAASRLPPIGVQVSPERVRGKRPRPPRRRAGTDHRHGQEQASPAPKERKAETNPLMGWVLVYTCAMPRAMLIVPSVTTKGVTLPLVITRPLSQPQQRTDQQRGGDDQRHGPAAVLETGDSTPARANIEPTERSIPAVRITKVMPTAMIPWIEVWRTMFAGFGSEERRRQQPHARLRWRGSRERCLFLQPANRIMVLIIVLCGGDGGRGG